MNDFIAFDVDAMWAVRRTASSVKDFNFTDFIDDIYVKIIPSFDTDEHYDYVETVWEPMKMQFETAQ